MSDRIPVMVDQSADMYRDEDVMRGPARDSLDGVIDVAVDVLRERMGELVRMVSDAAADAPVDGAFQVEEMRFTLHIGGNGEISLLSLAKAGVAAGAGIEVTLRKRDLRDP